MTPIVEMLERQIIASGKSVSSAASQEELNEFAAQVSNPADVKAYLEKWNDPSADVMEGLEKVKVEDEDDEIEVVVSDDEDDDEEDEDDLDDFIVEVGEDEDGEDQDDDNIETKSEDEDEV